MTLLDKVEHATNVRDGFASHLNVSVGVMSIPVLGSPRTPSRQRLVQSEAVPVRVGRPPQYLPRLDVHVEQNGIVIGAGALPPRAEYAAEGRDVLLFWFLRQVDARVTLRNDPKGRQRCVRRQQRRHPVGILNPLLYDPIPPVGGVLVEVYAHSPLLVPVLHDDARSFHVRRDGNALFLPIDEERPLVLHVVSRGDVVEEGVEAGDAAVQPPVREPVVGGQQAGGVLPADARRESRLEPLVE
mmetsp:Transcript_19804/g.57465  ORF Transcript_19804/g.57465 Transcript_19804/m.57465 type:complete len:242 (-) Transcript_19804:622-1347(-)